MVDNFVIEKFLLRSLGRVLIGLLVLAMVAYVLDWAVWRTRVSRGGGMGAVQVDRFTVGELKGGKEDYYLNGTMMVACSESLYPQGGSGACWWVRRHPDVVTQY